MKTTITTTTIHVPYLMEDYIRDILRHGRQNEVDFVITGDRKTPPEAAAYCRALEERYGIPVLFMDEEAQEDLRANRNLGVYKGALYENIVGEAFVKSGLELYYYKREDSTLEADFFARTASELVPVEVKAANGRAKSLRTLIESGKYEDIHWGVKFVKGNLGFENQIYTFPYFCAFLLKRWLRSR